jgi:hypothetical protein
MEKEVFLTASEFDGLNAWLRTRSWRGNVKVRERTSELSDQGVAGETRTPSQRPVERPPPPEMPDETPSPTVTKETVRDQNYLDSNIKFIWTPHDPSLCGACVVNNALQEEVNVCDGTDNAGCRRNMTEAEILLEVFRHYPDSDRFFPNEVARLEKERSKIIGVVAKVDQKQTANGCAWVALMPFSDGRWILLGSSSITASKLNDIGAWTRRAMNSDDGVFIAVCKEGMHRPKTKEEEAVGASLRRNPATKKQVQPKELPPKRGDSLPTSLSQGRRTNPLPKKQGRLEKLPPKREEPMAPKTSPQQKISVSNILRETPESFEKLAEQILNLSTLPDIKTRSGEITKRLSLTSENWPKAGLNLLDAIEDAGQRYDEKLEFDSDSLSRLNAELLKNIWRKAWEKVDTARYDGVDKRKENGQSAFLEANKRDAKDPRPLNIKELQADANARRQAILKDVDMWDMTMNELGIAKFIEDASVAASLKRIGALLNDFLKTAKKNYKGSLGNKDLVENEICVKVFAWVENYFQGNEIRYDDIFKHLFQKRDCKRTIPILLKWLKSVGEGFKFYVGIEKEKLREHFPRDFIADRAALF